MGRLSMSRWDQNSLIAVEAVVDVVSHRRPLQFALS